MKYIRKAIALVLVAVFIAAVAIGLSVIFAVRNINVFTVDYTASGDSDGTDEFADTVSGIRESLSQFEGRTIVTVNEEDISAIVAESGYAEFVSAERVYPCTINVTVKERLEVFAVPADDSSGYVILDGNCNEMVTKAENVNNLDGSPNVLLDVPQDDYALVADILSSFGEKFSSVRAFAESVTAVNDSILGELLRIKLRCGVTMEIREYKVHTEEKAQALFNAFDLTPDYLKLDGYMYCMETDSGAFRVILPDGSII